MHLNKPLDTWFLGQVQNHRAWQHPSEWGCFRVLGHDGRILWCGESGGRKGTGTEWSWYRVLSNYSFSKSLVNSVREVRTPSSLLPFPWQFLWVWLGFCDGSHASGALLLIARCHQNFGISCIKWLLFESLDGHMVARSTVLGFVNDSEAALANFAYDLEIVH